MHAIPDVLKSIVLPRQHNAPGIAPEAERGGMRARLFLFGMLLSASLVDAFSASAAETTRLRAGSPMPACVLERIHSDQRFELAAQRGKVTYIDFWASWCAPCTRAFPFLNRLHAELADRGLQVIGISVDERPEDAQRFLERHPARFLLGQDRRGSCPRAFGLIGMPSSYLIDREGIVRAIHVGFRDGDASQRRAEIEQLLVDSDRTSAAGERSR